MGYATAEETMGSVGDKTELSEWNEKCEVSFFSVTFRTLLPFLVAIEIILTLYAWL